MALSFKTRRALEISALFLESALRRAKTTAQREEATEQLHWLCKNMLDAGCEATDFKKMFPTQEAVFVQALEDVKSRRVGALEGQDETNLQ
jgi:hypothetical protein